MEIILKQVISGLGKIGDIINVKNGYAFNYLIPQGKAVIANKSNLAELEKSKELNDKKNSELKSLAEFAKGIIDGKPVIITKVANDFGVLYGTVNPNEVANYLNENYNVQGFLFSKEQVILSSRPRSTGIYNAVINLYYGISAKVIISIGRTPEEAENFLKKNAQ